MQDHYRLLGVNPDASPAELKKAFRRRVKEIHPDLNPLNPDISKRMQDLVDAYTTLVDPVLREEYNSASRRHVGENPFDYRQFLKGEGGPENLAKLIFYDLLHDFEEEAVGQYRSLITRSSFSLRANLDREDFMDCAYILAEELELRSDYFNAFELYFQISQLELQKSYFRFFFEEVIIHLRTLLGPASPLPEEKILLCLERTIQLGLPAKETAWFMKSAAEAYLKRNQRPRALFYLQESLRLDSRLTGIKDLRRKLRVV